LLSLKYPNKQKRLIYQIPVSLSLSVWDWIKTISLYNHKLAFCFPSRKNYLDQVQTVNTFTFLSPLYTHTASGVLPQTKSWLESSPFSSTTVWLQRENQEC
jgi:hypothetical protein